MLRSKIKSKEKIKGRTLREKEFVKRYMVNLQEHQANSIMTLVIQGTGIFSFIYIRKSFNESLELTDYIYLSLICFLNMLYIGIYITFRNWTKRNIIKISPVYIICISVAIIQSSKEISIKTDLPHTIAISTFITNMITL